MPTMGFSPINPTGVSPPPPPPILTLHQLHEYISVLASWCCFIFILGFPTPGGKRPLPSPSLRLRITPSSSSFSFRLFHLLPVSISFHPSPVSILKLQLSIQQRLTSTSTPPCAMSPAVCKSARHDLIPPATSPALMLIGECVSIRGALAIREMPLIRWGHRIPSHPMASGSHSQPTHKEPG